MKRRGRWRLLSTLAILLLVAAASTGPLLYSENPPVAPQYYRQCTVHIAAVSSAGGGVLGNLTVTIVYPGHGRVYISTSPAAEVDTQGSARAAAFAASLLAGVNMLDYDFYYDIESPSIIVGGPSAGAEMAAATYLLLTGGECNSSIVATGMIQPDTSIGPVGGLKEKLEAVAQGGGKIFVIPAGQENYTYYVTKVIRKGPFTFVTREPVTVNLVELGEKLGVKVYTAATLYDLVYIEEHGIPPSYRPVNLTATYKPPEYAVGAAEKAYASANSTLAQLLSQISSSKSDTVKSLASTASALALDASNLAGRGYYYPGLILAENALVYARAGLAIDEALNNDLNVTWFVKEVNNTVDVTWKSLLGFEDKGVTTTTLYPLLKAFEAISLSSYYYTRGLSRLDQRGNGYYLPWSIFTGIKIDGIIDLSLAESYAELAGFWANLTTVVEPGSPLPNSELHGLAMLLEANAKSLDAYTSTLLQETGQSTTPLDPAFYLVEQAITTRDPVQVMAYSLEAIVRATSVIQEYFPLDTNRTIVELEALLQTRIPRTQTPLLNLTLQEIMAATTGIDRLRVDSELMLETWLLSTLAGETTPIVQGKNSGGHPAITPALPPPPATGSQTPLPEGSNSGTHRIASQKVPKEEGKAALSIIVVLSIIAVVLLVITYRESHKPA